MGVGLGSRGYRRKDYSTGDFEKNPYEYPVVIGLWTEFFLDDPVDAEDYFLTDVVVTERHD